MQGKIIERIGLMLIIIAGSAYCIDIEPRFGVTIFIFLIVYLGSEYRLEKRNKGLCRSKDTAAETEKRKKL